MKRKPMILLVVCGVVGLALVGWSLFMLFHRPAAPDYSGYTQGTVTIGGHAFHVAVADTMATRAQGLSGRESMGTDEAMLFVFPISAQYSFWMKDMHFPLDMIWIRDGKIGDISQNVPVPPEGASVLSLPTVTPKVAVDRVLEVNAGLAAKYGWHEGDAVQIVLQTQ